MNNKLKAIIKYAIEVIVATAIWCLLDYLFGDTVNIISNLIDVSVVVLIANLLDFIISLKMKK